MLDVWGHETWLKETLLSLVAPKVICWTLAVALSQNSQTWIGLMPWQRRRWKGLDKVMVRMEVVFHCLLKWYDDMMIGIVHVIVISKCYILSFDFIIVMFQLFYSMVWCLHLILICIFLRTSYVCVFTSSRYEIMFIAQQVHLVWFFYSASMALRLETGLRFCSAQVPSMKQRREIWDKLCKQQSHYYSVSFVFWCEMISWS